MDTSAGSMRRQVRFAQLPLAVWHDPGFSLSPLKHQELADSSELVVLGISPDGKWYAVQHSSGLGWVSKNDVELPEPSLKMPEGLDKIGLCANQALTPSGEVAARLQDPATIAESGVRWVRLNFMQIGNKWLDRYGEIVDGLRGRGLQIYATLSHDIIGLPGLIMQDTPQNPPDRWEQSYQEQMDWIERYIETCEEILGTFQGRIAVYETLNEPDLWMEGKGWMNSHWFAFIQDRLYRRLKPNFPVKIVLGPLQGTTSGNGAPHYLSEIYQFGQMHLGWLQDGSPFDGIGYHIYNWPADWGGTQEEAQGLYKAYLDELWEVVVRYEGTDTEKKVHISEFGYPSTLDISTPKAHEDWQAAMMEAAIAYLSTDDRVGFASWFCTEDFDSPGEMFGLYVNGYGAIPTDRKQAFFTLRDLMTTGTSSAHHGARGFA